MGHVTCVARSIVNKVGRSGILVAFGLTACTGLDAGIEYPRDLPADLGPQLLTPENQTNPPLAFNRIKVAPSACDKIDTHAVIQKLNQEALTTFLEAQGAQVSVKKARDNLYWYEFKNGRQAPGDFVRLRLAVLEDAPHASADLHQSVLEHGPGWWGVRRSNLALLAPKATLPEALGFALKYKLVCWGIFTYAGVDDAYVVPGPYSEL
jgi:hypothetical protein